MTPEDYELLFGEPPPPEADEPATPPSRLRAAPPPPPPQDAVPTSGVFGDVLGTNVRPPPSRTPPPQFTVQPHLAPPPSGTGHKPIYKRKRVMIPAAILGLAVLGGLLPDADEEPVETANEEITTEVEGATIEIVATSSTTAAPTTTTITVVLPATNEVTDKELAAANRQLEQAEVVDSFDDAPDYDRTSYTGDRWGDSDGDCQSDRHEILIEESLMEPLLTDDGCQVAEGLWLDSYDGSEYTDARLVTIDHVIPLAAAHRAGAWMWDDESRQAFASDIEFPATHVAVGQDVNQSKGDSGPDEWKPPSKDAWCRYAVDWISVKDRWSLAFTQTEANALNEMLETCAPVTAISAIAGAAIANANPVTTTASTTTTTTGDCHPNYSPCVEHLPGNALNCDDISGPVEVIGSDPYELDGDNDGVGCES